MRNIYVKKDAVKVCKKGVCVEAKGKYAEAITLSLVFTFVCIGIAALAKS
ncbi:MAG: hypothetical protein ACOCWB_02080 [Bacteroidota bacterium]